MAAHDPLEESAVKNKKRKRSPPSSPTDQFIIHAAEQCREKIPPVSELLKIVEGDRFEKARYPSPAQIISSGVSGSPAYNNLSKRVSPVEEDQPKKASTPASHK